MLPPVRLTRRHREHTERDHDQRELAHEPEPRHLRYGEATAGRDIFRRCVQRRKQHQRKAHEADAPEGVATRLGRLARRLALHRAYSLSLVADLEGLYLFRVAAVRKWDENAHAASARRHAGLHMAADRNVGDVR